MGFCLDQRPWEIVLAGRVTSRKISLSALTLLCSALTILPHRPASSKTELLSPEESKSRKLRLVFNDFRSSEMFISLQSIPNPQAPTQELTRAEMFLCIVEGLA